MGSPNIKKILLAVGFLAFVAAVGFGLYFLFFRSEQAAPITQETQEEAAKGGALPQAGLSTGVTTGGAQAPSQTAPTSGAGALPQAQTIITSNLTSFPANDITLAADGSEIQYYDSASGLFYKIDPNGVLTPLSDKQFFQVENAVWSGDKEKAVLEYPDGSNILYDFSTEKQNTLPKHWENFNFSPDGSKIICKSMGDDADSRWLITSNPDGTNAKIIAALGDNADKVQVEWAPNNQVVAFSRTGGITSNLTSQEVFLVGQNEENFKSLKVGGFNFKAKWTDEGDRILYSVSDPTDSYKPSLWVVDSLGDNVGKNLRKINLNTWVDKCAVLSGYKAYCAVPKTLEEGAGMVPELASNTDDVFYFVNLKTGATSFVGEPDSDYTVNQISVSEDEKYIYFTDTLTGTLHKMNIK